MTGNQQRQRVLLNEVRSVRERVESFEAQNPYLNFRYRDPETNFNRKSVKGVVARQIKLKDRGNSTAIETAAGGKVSSIFAILCIPFFWYYRQYFQTQIRETRILFLF